MYTQIPPFNELWYQVVLYALHWMTTNSNAFPNPRQSRHLLHKHSLDQGCVGLAVSLQGHHTKPLSNDNPQPPGCYTQPVPIRLTLKIAHCTLHTHTQRLCTHTGMFMVQTEDFFVLPFSRRPHWFYTQNLPRTVKNIWSLRQTVDSFCFPTRLSNM